MSLAVDNRQQSLLNGLPYEPRYQAPPSFTNPWAAATTGSAPAQLYAASLAPSSTPLDASAQQQQQQQPMRPAALNLSYPGAPVSTAPLATDTLNNSRAYATQYTASTSPNTYATATSSAFPMDYGNRTATTYGFSDPSRRPSHPSVASAPYFGLPDGVIRKDSLIDIDDRLSNEAQRNNFNDALEASRGMVSMSQSDITPRNIYGNPGDRSSVSSYGFPSAHSAHSSISGSSYAPSYYGGSVDSSVTDYSSASESVDMNSRTLPRPSSLIGNLPPAPQSMMGQFSSKVASSSQKKHKCKICDKRFTRPSSLQTHMYSHTGEKPFACEVEGCGRHFSVVSNLRRHRKVHKNEGDHSDDHPSPDD